MAQAGWRKRLAGIAMVGLAAGLGAAARVEAQARPAAGQAGVVPDADTAFPHVRGVRTGVYDAGKLLADAGRACPTVRALLHTIEGTDVAVMVEVRDGLANGRAFTTMMGARAGVRWLRVTIDAGQQRRQQAAFLAHELRHVVEVAAAPEVLDVKGLQRFYERIGQPLGGGHFETEAAVAAEKQALREAYAERE